jgi:hypothetical protein
MMHEMNKIQGNTPPTWKGRSTWLLWIDVISGWKQNCHKILEIGRMLSAMVRPSMVRSRLERLKSLGHCEKIPTMPQLLVASKDQLSFSLGADTKEFYKAQGIPWGSHNFRRFLAYPTTMMDPVGLFSSRDTIIQHVLQTFHRHATYDMVLLNGHERGLEEMQKQLHQTMSGQHLHQRSLDSLVEDGSYHERLKHDVAEFIENPLVEPRPIPEGLSPDPYLMLAMDQFKDVRGYTDYASRLPVGGLDVLKALVWVAFNETIGESVNMKIGPKTLSVAACDPDKVARHLGHQEPALNSNNQSIMQA